MGRPPVDNPKDNRFSIRMDNEMLETLTNYCNEKGISKGEAIRQGLLLLFKKSKK